MDAELGVVSWSYVTPKVALQKGMAQFQIDLQQVKYTLPGSSEEVYVFHVDLNPFMIEFDRSNINEYGGVPHPCRLEMISRFGDKNALMKDYHFHEPEVDAMLRGKTIWKWEQDESIYKSNEGQKSYWLLPGFRSLFKKSAGQGFMVSAFQNEYVNLLTLTKEDVVAINRLRRRSRKKPLRHFYLHTDGLYYSVHIFPFGKNRAGYWNGDNMADHTCEMMGAARYKYPDIFHVFFFDWSSGHEKKPFDGLNAHVINLNYGGCGK